MVACSVALVAALGLSACDAGSDAARRRYGTRDVKSAVDAVVDASTRDHAISYVKEACHRLGEVGFLAIRDPSNQYAITFLNEVVGAAYQCENDSTSASEQRTTHPEIAARMRRLQELYAVIPGGPEPLVPLNG